MPKSRYAEYVLVFVTIFIIPSFYFAEVYLILPALNERWSFWYTFHFVMSLFLIHNVAGNFGLGIQGPGNIRENFVPEPTTDWKFCSFCNRMAPPRSWHCTTCKYCVFKRDHHCHFFGCCVGYFNFRYFYMFVMHVFISMMYAMCVNLAFFVKFIGTDNFSWMSLFYFLFPFASLIVSLSGDNWHFLLIGVNFVLLMFTGILFIYHTLSLVKGKTAGESKHMGSNCYNLGLKANFTDSFGIKWYLVWLSPFLRSPMLGDGTSWRKNQVPKDD